jgi:hypothetical protein
MSDVFTQTSVSLADQLAAACGASDLAAAAAIDAEEGDEFLHDRLADQMAGAHLLTMRMAALADRSISAAAAGADQGSADRPLFDLAAARFAGAAARLNGRYCRALQTLRTLAGPDADEEDVRWFGISTEREKVPLEEQIRRLNRMKSYRRLQARGKPKDEPGSERPQADADEQACLDAAEHAARSLLADAGLDALASPSGARHVTLFAHQLAVTHRLVMRLTGRADAVVTAAADPLDGPEGLRLAHGAARLMERFRQGVAMLHRFRTTPDDPRPVGYFSTDPYSDYERERERANDIAHGIDPDTGFLVDAPREANAESPEPPAARPPLLLRRGRLRNGNPGGDFLAAARCGAKTRAGCCCRQPAMANGRCRFHGGKSTGPRSEAGRARARSNRLVHGLRSAEIIALSAAAAAAHRSLGVLLAVASSKKIHHREHREGSPAVAARAARLHPSYVSSVMNPSTSADAPHLANRLPAGHGVDRSKSDIAAGRAAILPFARPPRPVQSPCRNRLLRVRS